MKVLIVNDHVVCGGAEVQSLREKKILEENGIEVFYLYFDKKTEITDEFKTEDGFIRVPIRYGLLRRSFCKLGLFQKTFIKRHQINSILKELNPDFVHVNVISKEPIGIYTLLASYPTAQTLRDYTCVCPKLDCIRNGEPCQGNLFSDCAGECYHSMNDRLAVRLYNTVVEYRKNCIKKFITPSKRLAEYAVSNGYKNVVCVNNPIDLELFQKSYVEKDENVFLVKNYLWTGVINSFRYNGLKMLVEVFDSFKEERKVILTIAGRVDESLKGRFYKLINGKDYINYIGSVDNKKLLGVVNSSYAAVNPSLIMDNYPNTVLEALALGTLVIGSSMGGIPEMLADDRGYVFDNSAKGLMECLEKSYSLSKEEYIEKTTKARDFTLNNNSEETYYSKILSIIKEIADGKLQHL